MDMIKGAFNLNTLYELYIISSPLMRVKILDHDCNILYQGCMMNLQQEFFDYEIDGNLYIDQLHLVIGVKA
jgi:hypothetical protein